MLSGVYSKELFYICALRRNPSSMKTPKSALEKEYISISKHAFHPNIQFVFSVESQTTTNYLTRTNWTENYFFVSCAGILKAQKCQKVLTFWII